MTAIDSHAINVGDLDLPLPKAAEATWRMLNALYDLQDALHGSEGKLPKALAAFLSTVEGGTRNV